MRATFLVRALVTIVAAFSIMLAGSLTGSAIAGMTEGGTTPPPSLANRRRSGRSWRCIRLREHATAQSDGVDLLDGRIDKPRNLHKVNFTALVRVVEWAVGPAWRRAQMAVSEVVHGTVARSGNTSICEAAGPGPG